MHTYIHICMCIYMYTCICIYAYIHMYVYICMYTYVYVRIYVCMYIWIRIEIEGKGSTSIVHTMHYYSVVCTTIECLSFQL